MRIRPSGFMILALAMIAPAIAQAQKLDDDDKQFLLQVEPIIGHDEESTYKKLKDKADRLEFQKIFWARRDPNPKTPVNEFKEKYLKDLAIAGQRYAVPKDPRPGWTNHCGRVFLLFGEPDKVEQETRGGGSGRQPETWTYHDRPGLTFKGGKLELGLSAECSGVQDLDFQLDKIAKSKVVQPNLDYRLDKKGHLTKLAEMLPKDTLVRALMEQPRQDFPLATQVAFLKVSDGSTGVLGLVRGDLTSAASGGAKTVSLSLGAKAMAAGGNEAGWTEQAMTAPVGADGTFLASFKMGLKPGTYTLNVGALDTKGGKGSLTSLPIEVPDLSQVESAADGTTHPLASISSLVLVRSVEQLPAGAPADPSNPFAAFTFGDLRLTPYFGTTFHKEDEISILYQVYDLTPKPAPASDPAAPPTAKGRALMRILKDGKAEVSRSQWKQIATTVDGDLIGPIKLAGYQPGRYQVELTLIDKNANDRTLKQDAWFEVAP
jgi:GWxTD domain-containing protein